MPTKRAIRGFLPDFSRYIENHFPLDVAFENADLISKLQNITSGLITMKNPVMELKQGYCQKLEVLDNKKDKDFFKKIDNASYYDKIYYLTFGRNPYRIILAIKTDIRRAFFLALDTTHSVRKG